MNTQKQVRTLRLLCAALSVVVVVILACGFGNKSKEEYKVVRCRSLGDDDALQERVNALAAEGWEFAGELQTGNYYAVFKRSK